MPVLRKKLQQARKVFKMINKEFRNLLMLLLFVSGSILMGQAQTAERGKEIFDAKGCAACHAKDMTSDLVGPALKGVRERWEKPEDLNNWVRNSAEMIASGHVYSNELFEKFNKVPMLPYPDLTDEDIESLLLYSEAVVAGTFKKKAADPGAESGDASAVVDIDMEMLDKGKEIFNAKGCAACHSKDMKTDLVGPALDGVEGRWEKKEELYNWIRNSAEMIEAGHEYGTALFEKFNKVPMLPYPDLTDEDIDALLLYVQYPDGPPSIDEAVADTQVADGEEGFSFFKSNIFYILLFLISGGLVFLLAMVLAKLKNEAEEKEFGEKGTHNLISVLMSRSVLKFAMFAFIVFGIYFTAVKAMNLGRQQNYQPDQPINYSHKIHAGVNKIDCEFCHDGARRSKHAMIPGTNTCRICHKGIKNGSLYGTAEISKIYASIGFDPNANKYIDNYNDLSQEEVKEIFTTWIAKQNDDFDSYKINQQWENIVESLTNDQKKTVQGPIEWERIHNLPDHVYFNHAQHVEVGKIACQTCHGPIEEMEVVRQYAPLSMGWCINCHRETEIQFTENPYYKNYKKYHEEFVAGTRDHVTVEEIGGLDCQKCHY